MLTSSWRLFQAAVLLMPFVGVGVFALAGVSAGSGVQPSFLPLLAAILLAVVALMRESFSRPVSLDADAVAVVVALGWTLLTMAFTWRLDDLGLAGETPWSKSLKQTVLLAFFVTTAVLPSLLLARSRMRLAELKMLESCASIALLVATVLALAQLVSTRFFPNFADSMGAFFASNPSIAAGSEELYLGHSFTGIARARGSFPEPLHLGNYLLASIPITAASALYHRNWSRLWRASTVVLALVVFVATYSRGAYLGLGAIVGLSGLAMWRGALPRPRWTTRSLAITGASVALSTVVASGALGVDLLRLPSLLGDRLLQSLAGHDMSNLTRVYAWRAAWEMFVSAPFGGVGWGAYGFHYYQLAGDLGSGAHFGWPMANNLPLLVLAQTGIVGALLWSRALWPGLRWAWAGRRSVHPAGRLAGAICTVLSISLVGVFVHSLTFSQWNLPHIWILVGCSAAAARLNSEVV